MQQAKRIEEEAFELYHRESERKQREVPTTNPSETLEETLADLAELIANFTEAHTATIFLTQPDGESLRVAGYHSLSREFDAEAEIPFGAGLVGWTAENALRISVCPFEHDATTLLYYRSHEPLKSFIAVPILSSKRDLLGVIACDSMKSYAFPKITEKLLFNCAQQAASLIALHGKLDDLNQRKTPSPTGLETFLDSIRAYDSERALLTAACELPESLVARDALVILAVTEGGVGEGEFYAAANQSRAGNRLLDIVCKHKKIISSERVVVAPPSEDSHERSFLSVPFKVMGREAGSLNLLSEPKASFRATQIAVLEKIAKVIGRELERIRLRERVTSGGEASATLSWSSFALHVKTLLSRANSPFSLVRITVSNLQEIEGECGPRAVSTMLHQLGRLLEQVKRGPSPACEIYGGQFLLLTESTEARRTIQRLSTLLSKLSPEELTGERFRSGIQPSELLLKGMVVSLAVFPQDGTTLEELSNKTLELITPENILPKKDGAPAVSGGVPSGEAQKGRSWNFFGRP